MNRPLILLAWIVGILFIIVALMYFVLPAGTLPNFFPGHQTGLMKHHYKHGIGAFFLGLGCFAFAWFQGGKKTSHHKKSTESTTPTATQ